MIALVVAVIAGALMMIAAYMSTSGLRNTAWEKQQDLSATQSAHVVQGTPAVQAGAYVPQP